MSKAGDSGRLAAVQKADDGFGVGASRKGCQRVVLSYTFYLIHIGVKRGPQEEAHYAHQK